MTEILVEILRIVSPKQIIGGLSPVPPVSAPMKQRQSADIGLAVGGPPTEQTGNGLEVCRDGPTQARGHVLF